MALESNELVETTSVEITYSHKAHDLKVSACLQIGRTIFRMTASVPMDETMENRMLKVRRKAGINSNWNVEPWGWCTPERPIERQTETVGRLNMEKYCGSEITFAHCGLSLVSWANAIALIEILVSRTMTDNQLNGQTRAKDVSFDQSPVPHSFLHSSAIKGTLSLPGLPHSGLVAR